MKTPLEKALEHRLKMQEMTSDRFRQALEELKALLASTAPDTRLAQIAKARGIIDEALVGYGRIFPLVTVVMEDRPDPRWKPSWDEPQPGYSWYYEKAVYRGIEFDPDLISPDNHISEDSIVEADGGEHEAEIEVELKHGKVYLFGTETELPIPRHLVEWESWL